MVGNWLDFESCSNVSFVVIYLFILTFMEL